MKKEYICDRKMDNMQRLSEYRIHGIIAGTGFVGTEDYDAMLCRIT